ASPTGEGVFWARLIALFSVPLTVLVAVPAFFLLRRHVNLFTCIASGLLIGWLGAGLFLLATNWLAFLGWAPTMLAIGALSGAGFWLIGLAGQQPPTAPPPVLAMSADEFRASWQ